jgi:hypothetical protein
MFGDLAVLDALGIDCLELDRVGSRKLEISIARRRIARCPVPDALVIQRAHGPIQQCDPVSLCCSRSIEVFPELRQRRATYD